MPRAKRLPIVLNSIQRLKFLGNINGHGPEATCWLWGGRVDDFGYGHFKVQGRSLKAHRVMWTLDRGPIPDDKTLDHLCRNPRCVNPSHLQLVTNKENILRGESPTAKNARQTHCKRGHLLDVDNIYFKDGHRDCKLCAKLRKADPHAASTGKPSTRV